LMLTPDFSRGLVTAVIQDIENDEVLMLAHMDAEAWELTVETGYVHYYSRSRGKIWKKGEESGHVQRVVEIRLDCDRDAVLLRVEQEGGACHEGYRSCFFRDEKDNVIGEKVFEPGNVYGRK